MPADRSILRPDGSIVPVECAAASMHADDGTAIGAVLVARDVSESRRAQQGMQDLAMVAARTDNAVVITATVPKISCIIRKMYGGSIPAMGVHQIGFDQVFAWPTAEMQMVGAEASVRVLFNKEMKAAKDQKAFFLEKVQEYQETYLTPYHSASRSVIDAVIHPRPVKGTKSR